MKFANAINYYKQHGLLAFLKRIFDPDRIGFKIFSGALIFQKIDLNNVLADCSESYSFIIATVDDIQKEPDYYDSSFSRANAIRYMQKGHRLFVLKENEKMVCFIWVETKSVQIPCFDLHFNIPEDMAYLAGLYTLPGYRNRGLAYKLKKEVMLYLKKEGFNHLIAAANPNNATALELNKKLGFKKYQSVHYRRYWFLKYYCIKKFNSNQQKRFITVLKAPDIIWKAFI